jgi:hypothetical protein
MNTLRLLTVVSALAVTQPAAANDKNSIDPREVAHCMVSRMKANRGESYREAFKVCKQQLDPSNREANGTTAMNTANVPEQPKH